MSDRMPEQCQKACQNRCQRACQNECQNECENRTPDKMRRMSEWMPTRMSEGMSEYIPESMPDRMSGYVRVHVRRMRDRITKYMLERMPDRISQCTYTEYMPIYATHVFLYIDRLPYLHLSATHTRTHTHIYIYIYIIYMYIHTHIFTSNMFETEAELSSVSRHPRNCTCLTSRNPQFLGPRSPRVSLHCLKYHPVIKHGWLENPLSMTVLMGKSLVNGPFSSQPCLSTRGYPCIA